MPSDQPPRTVRATTVSARLEIVAERRDDVLVDGDVVGAGEPLVTLQSRSTALRVRVPEGTELVLGTTSGRIEVEGRVGPVKITSASGRVEVEQAARVDIRTTSARVGIGACAGMCRVYTESGRVDVGLSDGLDVHTTSGRIEVDRSRGSVHVLTTSGRIGVGLDGPASVDAETVSGRITIELAAGLGASVTTQGGRRAEVAVPEGDQCAIRTRAVSGRIKVRTR